MSRLTRLSVPLVAVVLLGLAASPAFQGGARDGKAQAVERGEIDVEALQRAAVEQSAADQSASAAAPIPGSECSNGLAGPYPCENVDLLSVVTTAELLGLTGADVWGWTDTDGREIAISTTTYGMVFVDVTTPESPVVLGRVYVGAEGNDRDVLWRDVKVYEDHAFLVSEHDGTHLIVFDLTRLREFDSDQGTLDPDVVWEGFASAHNIAINTDTGFAYVVGGNTCDGGLHFVDVRDPKDPKDAGCFADDGYTHDVQCVVYEGPDPDHQGSEICFASNEDTVTIVDVSDKSAPKMLSRIGYDSASYTHQGWLTADQAWFVFGDETDELLQTVSATTTYILDVSDLDAPGEVVPYTHETRAIDHNLYVHDGLIYQANYSAGLRVLDFDQASLEAGELEPVAFFDVDPGPDAPVFAGAWTAYPFFESGTIAVNTFDQGLFLLRLALPEETGGEGDDPAPAPTVPTPSPTVDADDEGTLADTGGGTALVGLMLLGAAAGTRRLRKR